MEFCKDLFSPSKTTFLTLSNWFFHGRKLHYRQCQRAGDLSLLPHLFHNHARARAAVGLSLALSHFGETVPILDILYITYNDFIMYTATSSMRYVAQAISSSWKKKNYNFVFANLVFVHRTSDHVIWLVDDDDGHKMSVVVVCRPPRNPKKKVTGFLLMKGVIGCEESVFF